MEKIVCVAGPTASGKTKLAVELAKAYDGEVLSCDSMQIYRGMAIGTAAPTLEEMQGVVHHMIGVADPRRGFFRRKIRRAGRAGAAGYFVARETLRRVRRNGALCRQPAARAQLCPLPFDRHARNAGSGGASIGHRAPSCAPQRVDPEAGARLHPGSDNRRLSGAGGLPEARRKNF